MASIAGESAFTVAVGKAEGIRQAAKAAAFATWNYQQGAAFTTYVTALETADNAFITAVNAAASTSGPIGLPPPALLGPGGAAALPGTVLGNAGMTATSPGLGFSTSRGYGPVP
jgi:hypothetical protein